MHIASVEINGLPQIDYVIKTDQMDSFEIKQS